MEILKRKRLKPTVRWSDSQTKDLLNMILTKTDGDPRRFEKPTKREFYQAIRKEVLTIRSIEVHLIFHKMRNLKVSYFGAKSMREAAADIGQLEEQEVEEQVKRKCPFYEILHQIYKHQPNPTSDRDETSRAATENDETNIEDVAYNEEETGEEDDDAKNGNDSLENCSDSFLAVLKNNFEELVESVEKEELLTFEKILVAEKSCKKSAIKHLWRDDQTIALLEAVLNAVKYDSGSLRKRSPQLFYEKILKRTSEIPPIDWTVANNKMKHLKVSYLAAGALLKQQTSDARLDDDSLNEEIHRVCPFFDVLHQIYGREKSSIDEINETSAVMQIKAYINNDTTGNDSPQSEDPYPFEDEEDAFKPTEGPKKRRLRTKPNHSWTHKETKELLKRIWDEVKQNPNAFEKPTSRAFYERISPELCWKLCRNKLRNLRMTYKSAHTFREENPSTDKCDEYWLKSQLRKQCPFWDILQQIFGPFENTFLIDLKSNDDDGDDDDVDNEDVAKSQSSPPSFNSSLTNDLAVAPPSAENKDQFANAASQSPMQPNSGTTSMWAYKQEKLKFEREKVINDLEIRKLELQHQFEVRKLEVERDERLALAKMKFEMEERIRKYELELKLKNNSFNL